MVGWRLRCPLCFHSCKPPRRAWTYGPHGISYYRADYDRQAFAYEITRVLKATGTSVIHERCDAYLRWLAVGGPYRD